MSLFNINSRLLDVITFLIKENFEAGKPHWFYFVRLIKKHGKDE